MELRRLPVQQKEVRSTRIMLLMLWLVPDFHRVPKVTWQLMCWVLHCHFLRVLKLWILQVITIVRNQCIFSVKITYQKYTQVSCKHVFKPNGTVKLNFPKIASVQALCTVIVNKFISYLAIFLESLVFSNKYKHAHFEDTLEMLV